MLDLDIRNMEPKKIDLKTPRVTFRIGDAQKTSTSKDHTGQISFKAYPTDRRLCVVRYLRDYQLRLEPHRGEKNQLFLSYRSPHDIIGRDTIRRWTKEVMAAAGWT